MGVWDRFARALAEGASRLLCRLIDRAGKERDYWAMQHDHVRLEADRLAHEVDKEMKSTQQTFDYARAWQLHREAVAVADLAHAAFVSVHKVLDALGEAIVETAQQRRLLEEKRRRCLDLTTRAALQREIDDMHRLRDEYLVPDKDRLKAEKNRLLVEVRRLNQRTAVLRDLRQQRLQIEAAPTTAVVKFFDRTRGFGFVSTPHGDAYLPGRLLSRGTTLETGTAITCRMVRQEGRLRVEQVVSYGT